MTGTLNSVDPLITPELAIQGTTTMYRRNGARNQSRPDMPLLTSLDPDAERKAREVREYRDELARWLMGIDWTHFVILTFASMARAQEAIGHFHSWRRHLERCAQAAVSWFFIVERGRIHGRPHIHALIRHPSGATPAARVGDWRYGESWIATFDSSRQGVTYMLKQVHDPEVVCDFDDRHTRRKGR